MSATLSIESGQVEIARIVSDVFQTMLNLDVTPMGQHLSQRADGLTATVQFMGESKGALLLHCNVEQALAFTSRMLGEDLIDMTDDVRDVLGELANVVGGNLKSLFSPGMALSLPSVAEGNDYVLYLCGSNQVTTVAFASEVGVFHVSLARNLSDRFGDN
jgi:chemotaxis protein CheX